jgi:diguanylate cyclase (GGDEF)-like protein
MAAMSGVAWLSGLLDTPLGSVTLFAASLALFLVNLGVMVALADRQPQWLLRLSPYCYLTAAALLIFSQSDPHAGLNIILLLPVLAVAVRGGRRDSRAIAAAMVVALLLVLLGHHERGVVMLRILSLWGTLAVVLSLTIHGLRDRLEVAHHELAALAMSDPLTGVANRRGLERAVQSRRDGPPYALVCLDVDGLKRLNDTRGHQAGDELLVAVARVCRDVARAEDVVARLGGDELAVLLGDTDEAAALSFAQRLTTAIHALRIEGWPARVSIGVAAGESGADWEDVLRAADARMYVHKRSNQLGELRTRLPQQRAASQVPERPLSAAG